MTFLLSPYIIPELLYIICVRGFTSIINTIFIQLSKEYTLVILKDSTLLELLYPVVIFFYFTGVRFLFLNAFSTMVCYFSFYFSSFQANGIYFEYFDQQPFDDDRVPVVEPGSTCRARDLHIKFQPH